MRKTIQRICVKAKPTHSHPRYYTWQTASICMFIPEEDMPIAIQRARQELSRKHWELLRFEDRSTLIEERVKEAGGEVWEAFQQAQGGRLFFQEFPDQFGAGNRKFRPILPARITEDFIDHVIEDAGGRRLREDEKRRGIQNADYLIGKFIFELKDLQEEGLAKGPRQIRLARLFASYFPGEKQIQIDPSILSKEDYLQYLNIIGRPIQKHIHKASKQIKATRKLLNCPDLLSGIIFLNTGFGSFSHEAFAAQVERYAKKASAQFKAIVSISVWAHSNGFDTYVFYRFFPQSPEYEAVKAMKRSFESRFDNLMTDAICGGASRSGEDVSPVGPIAFTEGGIDFSWIPPHVPFSWKSKSNWE